MLTEKDQLYFKQKGISLDKINTQLLQFKNGFPFMDIKKPASVSDGIILLDEEQKFMFTDEFRRGIGDGCTILKFVPASGAATRMFKDLFSFINAEPTKQEELKKSGPVNDFLSHVKYFAFSDELEKKSGINLSDNESVIKNGVHLVKTLLLSDGLNYGNYPKGVLTFHTDGTKATTPIEEHMIEGALYGQDDEGIVNLHFTVSEDHLDLFKSVVDKNISMLEAKYDIRYNISYSTQKPSTDTMAVNPDNTPFRPEGEEILFRPAGHGALIENLNDLDADIIFIKNIDNVIPEYRLKDTIQYKEALAGVLYLYQQKIFQYLINIDKGKINSEMADEILDFMQVDLFITIPDEIRSQELNQKIKFISSKINRPIRVCGMVKNEGEPGGGPFWATGKNGEVSLQIVESSQINLKDIEKANLLKLSTHFNPVDLVCGTKNYKGEKFDLLQYIDPSTGFISNKSLNGKELKALELPGLWNGAMSDWITLFVEVPVTTFNPVKTVNDLLRKQHQPEGSLSH